MKKVKGGRAYRPNCFQVLSHCEEVAFCDRRGNPKQTECKSLDYKLKIIVYLKCLGLLRQAAFAFFLAMTENAKFPLFPMLNLFTFFLTRACAKRVTRFVPQRFPLFRNDVFCCYLSHLFTQSPNNLTKSIL